jgi:hypothetical protein
MIDEYDYDEEERNERRRPYGRERYGEPAPRRGGCLIGSLIIAGALVVMGALFYLGATRVTDNLNPFADLSNPFSPAPTVIVPTGPVIIQQIQGVNRLETASMITSDVITAEKEGSALYNFFQGDRLILIVQGEVIAGFDLSELGPNNVVVSSDGITATVNLPPAQILVSRLDNEKTQVYSRDMGLLTRGDPNLESEARRVAERRIVELACESGILERAIEDGKRNIENLVKALGPETVIVNASEGECPVAPSPVPLPSP